MYCVGVHEHAPVGEHCHVLKCHCTMGRILCMFMCVYVYFTMIEEINVHVYMMCDMDFVYYFIT